MKTSSTGKMSGNGLMNDSWLDQTVKPSSAGKPAIIFQVVA
jgi:hypothetical protein